MTADDTEVVQRLSVLIGAIMEDEAGEAVTALPRIEGEALSRIARSKQAGSDSASLAAAAEVILRRGTV